MSKLEGYYTSIFYSYFASLGLDIRLEETTNQGRIEMAALFNGHAFEFKVVELVPDGAALQQPIHLIGVDFSKASRNIVGYGVEICLPTSKTLQIQDAHKAGATRCQWCWQSPQGPPCAAWMMRGGKRTS